MRVPIEWLKEFVEIRIGTEALARALTMGGLEVESVGGKGSSATLDIAPPPNRGDCLSVAGIAREVAALAGGRLKVPAYRAPKGKGAIAGRVRVRVASTARCRRYATRVIEGVRVAPPPAWMTRRLAACGIRSINNIVDATNYVMLETGQPLHAFDLSSVRGGRIVVREAGADMPFSTLDGTERRLAEEDLLICDGEGPVAIAGVMGGGNSEVRDSTAAILLESACFEPTGVRRSSKRMGLASESSRRFERGVDPNGTLAALHRLTEIILETAGGEPTRDWIDIYPRRAGPARLALTEAGVERILGAKIGAAKIEKALKGLGFGAARRGSGAVAVSVPTWRADVSRPIDLIEEVARVHGYGEIPATMPMLEARPLTRPRLDRPEELARSALMMEGLSEAVMYGFTSEASIEPFSEMCEGAIRITNPLSAEQGVMRTTLLPGLLDALKLNASRQRHDCRLFAIQGVYRRAADGGGPDEARHLAGAIMGRRFPAAWERAREDVDFYDAKGAVEAVIAALGLSSAASFERGESHGVFHPGASARVVCGGEPLGFVGQVHPGVAARWELDGGVFGFELRFDRLAELSLAAEHKFSPISPFPFVVRDIAVVVGEDVPAADVAEAIREAGVTSLAGSRVFDVYRGEGIPAGRKSLAFTLRFARSDRTLLDEEVNDGVGEILARLKMRLGAEVR